LKSVSLAPPALGEIRDEIPEIASQILLHFVEAGEVPAATSCPPPPSMPCATRPGRAATRAAPPSSRWPWAPWKRKSAWRRWRTCWQDSPPLPGLPLDLPLREAREIFERLYFEHHLQIDGGNMTRLAEKTGLERTHLYRKLKQLGISVGRRHEESGS
jgi:two-component system nitrogen regulation response regulator NtrX